MKMYEVEGSYNGGNVNQVVVGRDEDKVVVELLAKKPDFDQLALGEEHYDLIDRISFQNKRDALDILYGRREGSISRKYIKMLDLKITKNIL